MSNEDYILHQIGIYFRIGKITSYELLKAGRDSWNYRVNTESEDVYAFKIFRAFSKIRLQNEILLQKELKSSNIHSSLLVATEGQSYLYEGGNLYATVSNYIEGAHPVFKSPGSIFRLVGRTLGEFHTSIDPMLLLDNRYLFFGASRRNERLWYIPKDEFKERIIDMFSYCRPLVVSNDSLPGGVLHGDFHGGNLLLGKDHISVIDFQSVGNGPYLLDMGRSIADLCFDEDGDTHERSRIDLFVAGYEECRRLSSLERELMDKAIIFGASSIALWASQNSVDNLRDRMIRIGESIINAEKGLKDTNYMVV